MEPMERTDSRQIIPEEEVHQPCNPDQDSPRSLRLEVLLLLLLPLLLLPLLRAEQNDHQGQVHVSL